MAARCWGEGFDGGRGREEGGGIMEGWWLVEVRGKESRGRRERRVGLNGVHLWLLFVYSQEFIYCDLHYFYFTL